MLEDILNGNSELVIQKYLEEHPMILKAGIGMPEWTFNFILPQFRIGAKYRADFIVLTGQSNSYEITIVGLKRPNASLYNKNGTVAKDLNLACSEIDNYRRWINDNAEEFKRNLVYEIKKIDSSFDVDFDWTKRFRIYSKVVIGRRENLTREIRDKNYDMEEKGISIISYDRLIDAEKRLLEMKDNGIDISLYNNDDLIKEQYGIQLSNKEEAHEFVGEDNVLILGDEERESGLWGFYQDALNRESDMRSNDRG